MRKQSLCLSYKYVYDMKQLLLLLAFLVSAGNLGAKETGSLEEYMATQSMKWEQLPMQWNEGAFLGNGRIGMMVYVDSTDNSLTFWLSRPDVTDHRMAPHRKTSMGVMGASVLTDFCRMDIGKMKLFPQARIQSGTMELDIYDAELTGVLHTDAGDIAFRAFTPYGRELNVVEVESRVPCSWKQLPGSPRSPRIIVFPNLKEEMNYVDNPAPQCVAREHEGWSVHPLLAGGDYATYWKETCGKRRSVLYLSTMNEVPASGLSLPKAMAEVEAAVRKGADALREETRDWWRAYYETGTVCIPDKKMENFYHLQLYKLATCSHPQGPVMDTFGTFYKTSQWPGIWWNLNVQLTYMSTHATNRLEQGVNYQNLLDTLFVDIIRSRGAAKVGDSAWALHTYYSYMRYAGLSWQEIQEKFMPKAEAIYAMYLPHLQEKDNVINLLDTESPEYEGFKTYDNSNYNLAALRWLLQTMTELGDRTGHRPAKYDEWKHILEKLHPAPVDENGYMIGSDKPLAKSHRHYSHLLSFYPLRLQDTTRPEVSAVLEKSIDHWLGIDHGNALAGYSYTGAASLYAYQGNGDKAYAQLHHFFNKPIGLAILLPNTMYVESGGKNPVIETPLSAATAVTEFLLQGWGETLRVFPAVPQDWKDCSFRALRAEGGFVVSASRKGGKTEWVRIHSDAGRPCRIYLPGWKKVCQLQEGKVKVTAEGNGYYRLEIPRGTDVVLAENVRTATDNTYCLPDTGEWNFYGVKEGKGLSRQMDWPLAKE